MEILKHLSRTLVHIIILGAAFAGIVSGAILLRLPVILIPIMLVLLFCGYIYWSARRHAYWAPIAKKVMNRKWCSESEEQMETVVEKALVQAGAVSPSEVWRVSVYNRTTGRLSKRCLIGDDVVFLGAHGIGLWFFIGDSFHARRDGLLCVDLQAADWIYHVPKSKILLIEKGKQRGQFFAAHSNGDTVEMQLSAVKPNLAVCVN